jgi:hypothetical protein
MIIFHLIQAWRKLPTSANIPPDFVRVTRTETPDNISLSVAQREEIIASVFQATPLADDYVALNISTESQ